MTTLTPAFGASGDLAEGYPRSRRDLRDLASRVARPALAPAAARVLPASPSAWTYAASTTAAEQPSVQLAMIPFADDDEDLPSLRVPSQRVSVDLVDGSRDPEPGHVGFLPFGARDAREAHGGPAQVLRSAPPAAAPPAASPGPGSAAPAPWPAAPAPVPRPAPPAAAPAPWPAGPAAPLTLAPVLPRQAAHGSVPGWGSGSDHALPGAYVDRPSGGRAARVALVGLVLAAAAAAAAFQYFELVDVLGMVGL